jgi:hypothetical protein
MAAYNDASSCQPVSPTRASSPRLRLRVFTRPGPVAADQCTKKSGYVILDHLHINELALMQEQPKRWLTCALFLAVIIAICIIWQRPTFKAKPGAPAPAGSRTPAQKTASSALPQLPVAPIPVFNGESDEPIEVQVQRLIATNNGQQAFAAYWLLVGCTSFNQHHNVDLYDDQQHANRSMNADEQRLAGKVCASMTERDRQARLDYLAKAVETGIPFSAWIFATEGPFGDPSALKTRPDDPLVKLWKVTATAHLARDAERGEPATLIAWGMDKLNGSDFTDKDPVGGYGYLLAFGLIQADRKGAGDAGAQAYAEGSAMMDAIAADLSPEQRAAALAEAQRIASAAKTGKAQPKLKSEQAVTG